jgi:pimeloyl-ACP methyl ester carboxylesterase
MKLLQTKVMFCACGLASACLLGTTIRLHAFSDGTVDVQEREPVGSGVPFERFVTRDKFGRRITAYLSESRLKEHRPLAVFVLGSGCQSLFSKVGDKIAGGLQYVLLDAANNRVRVLVVEKPGVKFLDMPKQPGSSEGASQEFLEEHTLPRWAEAVSAALRAAYTFPDIDSSRTLVLGHSEGGIVAARVAAETPRVTHVASLAGEGPSQLFDLAELARRGDFGSPKAAAIKAVYDGWKQIQKDPQSTNRFLWGHPYRRWSSFLASSTEEELARSKARVYLAHGTDDKQSSVLTLDIVHADLLSHGRDVTAERLEGADHGFYSNGEKGYPAGMKAVLSHVVDWFLKGAGSP